MRLSTEIALGRTLVIPKSCVLHTHDGHGCALGMALAARGSTFFAYDEIRDAHPWLLTGSPDALPCGCLSHYLRINYQTAIEHLFDWHVMSYGDFTLDQLIDWVASVEPADASECVVEHQSTAIQQEAYAYG